MKKRGFTLIEILVSIVLLGLISLFVSSTIYQTKKNNKLFKNEVLKGTKKEIFLNTLYKDILLSTDLNISNNKNYTIIKLLSNNSVYGISHPYISWLVLKQNHTIIRLESAKKIVLPISENMQKFAYIDIVQKNCKFFQASLSKDKKSILVFIKIKKQKPIIYEINKL